MRRSAPLAVALVFALGGSAAAVSSPDAARPRTAKNIIYIQGDGMGPGQRDLIRLATAGRYGDLAMNKLPVTGLVHTDPADLKEVVTDSAASATALATGHKTLNGAIGVDVDGKRLTTVLERAKREGKATGLVTTAQVTGASPASFAAHVPSRDMQSEIGRQYLVDSRPDVMLGGGEDWWYPKGQPGAWPDHEGEESRSTAGNLVDRAKRLGYDYVSNAQELSRTRADRILGLFANEDMVDYGPDGVGRYAPNVPLVQMARKALDTLSRDRDGFFLFLEEEGIDGMSHENNAHGVIDAGKALEATVTEVLRFVKTHPDTLVIINGDHETGGLTIEDYDSDSTGPEHADEDGPFPIPGSPLRFSADWTTHDHTSAATPLTATGPGSDRLDGTIDNTEVYHAMMAASGWE